MKAKALAAMAAAALFLAACGDDGPGRDGFKDDLIEGGLSDEVATCVVDAIEDEYGSDVFDQSEPPDGLQEDAFSLASECATETLDAGGDVLSE